RDAQRQDHRDRFGREDDAVEVDRVGAGAQLLRDEIDGDREDRADRGENPGEEGRPPARAEEGDDAGDQRGDDHDARNEGAADGEMAAGEEDGGGNREDEQKVDGVFALEGDARDRHRDEADEQEQPGEVDPPALVDRIAAIDELLELRADKGPAGPGAGLGTGLAAGPGPHRVDDRPAHQRREDQDDEGEADDREDHVADRRKQPPAEPGYRAALAARRREHRLLLPPHIDQFEGGGHVSAPPARRGG